MKLILFLIFLFFLLFLSLSYKEGLGFQSADPVGKYDYLKPPPGPAVLSEETEKNFIEAFNKNVVSIFPEAVLDKDKMNSTKKFVTVAEVEYYVKHKKWPYGSALMYCLQNKKEVVEKLQIKKIEEIQKVWPTRLIFLLVCNGECSKTPASLECDIYSGKHKPSKEDK
jgi:hypothetical protein